MVAFEMSKHDMSLRLSKVDDRFLRQFCLKYAIGPQYKPTAPLPHHLITDCPDGYIALYTQHFEFSNLRIPFSNFFLNFLREYNLNISQLSPLGVIKVTHFEIACRAHGFEPSVPLLREFFVLARYHGDWYTVEKRDSCYSSCVSWVPRTVTPWKDSFFWVSADAIPFKMHWRERDEPLDVIDRLQTENFDRELYGLLVKHPTPVQRFPEHVLVMTGLSRNWPYPNAEPIIKDGDEEMKLVKCIEKKGLGDVKLTSRSLAEHEVNILDRTRGVCYEGRPSHVQSDTQANVNTKSVDVEIPSEHTTMEPKDVLEKETPSEGGTRLQPEVLASCFKRRRLVKAESNVVKSDHLNGLGRIEQLVGSVPEILKWQDGKAKKEARLRGQISKYRVRMSVEKTKNAKLVKKVKNEKRLALEKGKEAIVTVAMNTVEHAKVVGALQKELEGDKEMVEKLKGELNLERRDKVWLKKSLERVSSERRWLIEEGFEYAINRLHRSEEYLKPLGAVLSKLWSSGAHTGVVEGYAHCKAGMALENVGVYMPKAEEDLRKATDELEHMRFPYVVALSQCANLTLDDLRALEPIGLEKDEVVAGGDETDR